MIHMMGVLDHKYHPVFVLKMRLHPSNFSNDGLVINFPL